MSKENEKDELVAKGLDRREFLKKSAVGAGAVAATMVMGGCGSSSSSSAGTPVAGAAQVPTAQAFKFGVMADTQWLTLDDGYNPNTSAISIVRSLQQQFISQGVKFVVHVGDTCDKANTGSPTSTNSESGYSVTATLAEDTRALFAQDLYNAGIGFFPHRGNHDDSVAAEFARIYPQTQNGAMNATPSDIFSISNPDSKKQSTPTKSGSTFTLGSNFNSPSASILNQTGYTGNLAGLTYSFDYQNARFVMIDQFTPADGKGPDGNAYNILTTAALQQPWITHALSGRASGSHAFVFSHKGLITQQHQDVLFGNDPGPSTTLGSSAGSYGEDPFIRSMYNNSAHLYFCGHDHIHNRSIVSTIDGVAANDGTTANVTHILCSSDSSKFYVPNENDPVGNPPVPPLTSNNYYYCGGKRQTQLQQEVNTVGYYIVTVDGPNCSVDFYSAPVYPTNLGTSTENVISTTPPLNFTKRDSFGYSLNGKQFVLGSGQFYTAVSDKSSAGTTAKIIAGTNGILTHSLSPNDPVFSVSVNTGWYAAQSNTSSDILALWGMDYTLGSEQTDDFVLQMSFTPGSLTSAQLTSGAFGIASVDENGNWTNTVNNNFGSGSKAFIAGPWPASGAAVGTYGVDTSTNTAWAVINHNGYFAVVNGI